MHLNFINVNLNHTTLHHCFFFTAPFNNKTSSAYSSSINASESLCDTVTVHSKCLLTGLHIDPFPRGDLQPFFFVEMLLFFPLDMYVEKFGLQQICINIKLGAHCF